MTAQNSVYEITTTSKELGYLITHKAIMFYDEQTPYIIHMTFDGVELTTPEKLLRTRTLIKKTKHILPKNVSIDNVLTEYKNKPFNLITNNCETFVNDFINKYTTTRRNKISGQVVKWTVILIIIITLIHKNK